MVDFKYGIRTWVDVYDNFQLIIYAICALDFINNKDIRFVRLHIFQSRMDNVQSMEYSVKDLEKHRKYIQSVADSIENGDVTFTPGDKQCLWCKAKPRCKAYKNKLEQDMRQEFANLASNKIPANKLSDEELVEVIKISPAISKWLKSVKEHLEDTINSGTQIPGVKMGYKRTLRSWRNEKEAIVTLRKYGIDPFAHKLISPSQALDLIIAKGGGDGDIDLNAKAAVNMSTKSTPCALQVVPVDAPESVDHYFTLFENLRGDE